MRTVVVKYHKEEDGAWIGTSSDVPGYVGHGDTFDTACQRVQEGLPWFAEEPDMLIAHVAASNLQDAGTYAPKVLLGITTSQPRPRYTHHLSGVDHA
jgi:predicted RNase H-like HicB family nuclease